jgi:hypothetical protein
VSTREASDSIFLLAFDDCADRMIRVNTLIFQDIMEFCGCFIFPDAAPFKRRAEQSRADTASTKKTCKRISSPSDKPVRRSASADTGIHSGKNRGEIKFESRI